MISARNLTLQFGEKVLFRSASFLIGPHDRIGLVGSNGAGKSTLLRILAATEAADKGQIEKSKFINVGYLPQEGMHAEGMTLYKEVELAFADILEVESRLADIGTELEATNHESDRFHELLEIQGELQHALQDLDAYRMKSKIEKVLLGLGFRTTDFERKTEEFSGGWQMRIALAKLLLLQPSLLLLDEPTNHLDLDSLEWLEEYLRVYDGAVMIVSHDRRFLDTMTNRTFELSQGNLTEYQGNFSFYLREKEARRELQISAMKNQQQQLKQTQQFIDRFRYKATKARQVQSRIKQLEKVDIIQVESDEDSIHFSFPPAPQSGRSVIELKSIFKRYGDLRIFEGIDFDVERGDRIAFVGVNGAGKSTLSRIIAGVESFDSGKRHVGHNVVISYFAQHQAEELDPEHDVLETVDEVATGEIRKKLRTLLGGFLFQGDDVFKKVGVLSGGEKSRLALAKMLLQPSNLLVMDEPTNHLDMRSKAILQSALNAYSGSFVIVSHDRDFLDPIVNRVVEFREGRVKSYPGNLSEFLSSKHAQAGGQFQQKSQPTENAPGAKERKRLEAEDRQRKSRLAQPLREQVNRIEADIKVLEERKKSLEQQLEDPTIYRDGDKARELTAEYKHVGASINALYEQWTELSRKLEQILN